MDATATTLMARLRQSPLDTSVLESLRVHCDDRADFATWAEALELHARALAEAEGDPGVIGRIHLMLGHLWRDQLQRADRALVHYRTAIDFDAAQREAMQAARAIFTGAGRWDQVVKLLSREIDSLPEGMKRVPLMAELANVYDQQLGDKISALAVLREATQIAPEDLHLLHQLATLLLDVADNEPNAALAAQKRREAADVLCNMAASVGDDYAFAYLEAALDAVPSHPNALAMLEQVAPRLGREDAVPARWVAAIQDAPETRVSRDIRLKLARAYQAAGQFQDVRACLAPLLAGRDARAQAILRELEAQEPPDSDDATMVADDDMLVEEPSKVAPFPSELAREEFSTEDLSEVTILEKGPPLLNAARAEGGSAIDDLRLLAAADRTVVDEPVDPNAKLRQHIEDAVNTAVEPLPPEGSLHAQDARDAGRAARADQASDALPELEPEALSEEDALLEDEEEAMAVATSELAEELEGGDAHLEAETDDSTRNAIQAALAELPEDAEDRLDGDLGGEVTQPRAHMDIPAEARGSTEEDELLASTPHVPIRMPVAGLREGAEPPAPTKQPPPQVEPEPEPTELEKLRADMARRLRFRDRRAAAHIAERILELEPGDTEAFAALEQHLRTIRDVRRLRDLLWRMGNEAALPADTRIERLREAALLSESKLNDAAGAHGALERLLSLAPDDEDAFDRLRLAYHEHARWEDLAALLQNRAARVGDRGRKAALYREIGDIQAHKRGDTDGAIEAYQEARALSGTPADDQTLSELLLAANRLSEAAQILEARLDYTEEAEKRIPLLRQLAELYEHSLHDSERAYEVTEMLLALVPDDLAAFDRLERIDASCQRYDRLLETLETRLEFTPAPEQPAAWMRIAELALEQLHDIPKALEACRQALTLAPAARELWPRAAQVFADARRPRDYTELLWGAAQNFPQGPERAELLREVAQHRLQHGDPAGALEAFEALFAATDEHGALCAIVDLLRDTPRTSELAQRLDQLAARSEPAEAHALRMERARLLEDIGDLDGAKAELDRVLAELAPRDIDALTLLISLAKQTGEHRRAAQAQERLLPLLESAEARAELAEELLAFYADELSDLDAALGVLKVWTRTDPMNPQPLLRSLPWLEQLGRKPELLAALDRLATLAMAEDEVGDFVLRAARTAMALGNADEAWSRLLPRVVESHDPAAEALLREIAEQFGRGEQLAELYVGLAQRAPEPLQEKQRWLDAAQTYELMLGAPDKALEATLRAFAKDLDNATLLEEAERLTELAHAWPRLAKVYDTLVRREGSTEGRVRILMRHAKLLEARAKDANAAFERAAIALQLDPSADDTYREACRLAAETQHLEDLLPLHERRAAAGVPAPDQVEALLAACAIAQHVMNDPPRAMGYLTRAVAVALHDDALLDSIEAKVRALDAEEKPLDGRGLTFALAQAYAQRSEEDRRESDVVVRLSTRAAVLYGDALDDADAAYRTLERATSFVTGDEALLTKLEQSAERAGCLDKLAEHLQRVADDALDSASASAALRRLGALYAGPLSSPDRAAEVYKQLVTLRPRDLDASDQLRKCLGAAGRHKDLLGAIDRHLLLVQSEEDKLPLLKEAARVWEHGLKNRFEAKDAWRRVLAIAPEDAEASEAVSRLEARPTVDDASLLEADLVVTPEDLHPSIPPEPPQPSAEAGADAGADEAAPAEASAAEVESAEAPETAAPATASAQASADEAKAAAPTARPGEDHEAEAPTDDAALAERGGLAAGAATAATEASADEGAPTPRGADGEQAAADAAPEPESPAELSTHAAEDAEAHPAADAAMAEEREAPTELAPSQASEAGAPGDTGGSERQGEPDAESQTSLADAREAQAVSPEPLEPAPYEDVDEERTIAVPDSVLAELASRDAREAMRAAISAPADGLLAELASRDAEEAERARGTRDEGASGTLELEGAEEVEVADLELLSSRMHTPMRPMPRAPTKVPPPPPPSARSVAPPSLRSVPPPGSPQRAAAPTAGRRPRECTAPTPSRDADAQHAPSCPPTPRLVARRRPSAHCATTPTSWTLPPP